jgi:hypothetical protein
MNLVIEGIDPFFIIDLEAYPDFPEGLYDADQWSKKKKQKKKHSILKNVFQFPCLTRKKEGCDEEQYKINEKSDVDDIEFEKYGLRFEEKLKACQYYEKAHIDEKEENIFFICSCRKTLFRGIEMTD